MSSALNGSSALQHFKRGKAVKIGNGIMFDFYPGWPHIWQSHVEIKGYSVTYFDRITAFEVPYCWASIKGGAHTRFVGLLDIPASTKGIWAPPLVEVQRYGASNTVMRLKYVME